jgi:uroporphyrinogen-III synthase
VTGKSLAGFRIGVTADRRAEEQMRLLADRGATCLHGPTVTTDPTGPPDELRHATETLIAEPPDVLLITTGIGVRGWMETAESFGLDDELRTALADTVILARDPESAARSDELIDELERRGVAGRRVAAQLDGAAGTRIGRGVRRLGATFVPVPVYRWPLPDDLGPAERLVRATCDARLDAVTFTSRPAVENLLEIADRMDVLDDLIHSLVDAVVAVCIGDVCAGALRELGGEPLVPPLDEPGAMVQFVADHFDSRSRLLQLGDHRVVIQGRSVSVNGGEAVTLTDREREVLAALAERPGAVLSKRALLDRVWGAAESDEHVVEVTIARLRQRLGSASGGIETVIRRGYRLRVSPV